MLILDNSPASYIFHPDNAIACQSWFDDAHDTELRDLIPFFERLASVDSVYTVLKQGQALSQPRHHHHMGGGHHHALAHFIATACGAGSGDDGVVPNQASPPPANAVIYQFQQPAAVTTDPPPPPPPPLPARPSALNNLNYLINENKMLLSIDMMMATKQQQLSSPKPQSQHK